MVSNGYLELPKIDPERFNKLSRQYYPDSTLLWVEDEKNPGIIDPDEIKLDGDKTLKDFIEDTKGKPKFTPLFDNRYRTIIELARNAAVRAHLDKTKLATLAIDLAKYKLSQADHKFISQMLKVGKLMDQLFQMQLGSYPFADHISRSAAFSDRELMSRYQMPWCDENPDPLCNGLSTFTPYRDPNFPEGMTSEEAKKIGSPFTVIASDESGGFQAIPYSNSFMGSKMREAAKELRKAAGLADTAKEKHLAKYIGEVADAFESDKPFPYAKSDEAWAQYKDRSKYYLRVGPDEIQWHPFMMRAGFAMTFGLVNPRASASVQMYKKIRQKMEDDFAKIIGAPYKARKVDVSLPDFIDVLAENGDQRGSIRGTPAAQSLPNWCGVDGTGDCQHRTMLFFNVTSSGYSPEIMEAYGKLLNPENMRSFNPELITNGIVDHEFTHNLGPLMNMGVEDGTPISEYLGDYGSKLEEFKAQIGALFFVGWKKERGYITSEEANNTYTAMIVWVFGQLRRAIDSYKRGEMVNERSPYKLLAAVILQYFQEQGAVSYDEEKGWFTIHYDKMHTAAKGLSHEIGQLYMKHDKAEIESFYRGYLTGDKLKLLHMDKVEEAIGSMPTTLFAFDIKNLKE